MIAQIFAQPRHCGQCERDRQVVEIMGGHYAILGGCGHAARLDEAEIAGVRVDLKGRGWKFRGGAFPPAIRG